MIKRCSLLIALSILFNVVTIFGSDSIIHTPPFIIGARFHYGMIYKHDHRIPPLIKDQVKTLEIAISLFTTGKKQWQTIYNTPDIGLAYLRIDLGNDEQLGISNALFPFIHIPLRSRGNLEVNFRFGAGFAYFRNIFDRFTNYKNLAIGSPINVILNLVLETNIYISKNISINSGISFIHFSNGAFKLPNLGLNISNVNFGTTYSFGRPKEIFLSEKPPMSKTPLEFSLFTGFGFKEIYPIEGPKYFACTLSGLLSKQINHIQNIGIGLDAFYDHSDVEILRKNDCPVDKNIEAVKFGFYLSHIVSVSKLSFLIQAGSYLYALDRSEGSLYARTGFRYNLNDRLFANLTLKAHLWAADFVEFGIGYKLIK